MLGDGGFPQPPALRTWLWRHSTYLTSCFAFHRIFSSNLKERMAQRFYNLVLLPRVRDDIAEYKRLNFHLYMALKKALFKPGAWFKGRGSLGGCTPRVGACCNTQQLSKAVCCTTLLLYTALFGAVGAQCSGGRLKDVCDAEELLFPWVKCGESRG